MTVTISLFWMLMLITIINTVLQHVINSGWRSIDDDNPLDILAMTAVTVIELIAIAIWIYFLIN